MVSGTLFWHRERLEPSVHIPRSEGDDTEEVAPAGSSRRLGYESACSDGLEVQVDGKVISDLVDDILWDSGARDNRLDFQRGRNGR